jgi:hypothetical protein
VTTLEPRLAGVGIAERRRIIADIVHARAYVSVRELSADFAVTPTTIRTDLAALAGLGALIRVSGGAVRIAPGHQVAGPGAHGSPLGTSSRDVHSAAPVPRRVTVPVDAPSPGAVAERRR